MATLTVRDLDEQVYEGLKQVASERGVSMEAEARAILSRAVRSATWWDRWVEAVRAQPGDEELVLPQRSTPRVVDL